MEKEKKKALMDAYKRKEIIGGIYCIECTANGQKVIKSTRDLESIKNRYEFGISINSCPEPAMRDAWNAYGIDTFKFSVVESLKRTENQTDKEYGDDLKALLEMYKSDAK